MMPMLADILPKGHILKALTFTALLALAGCATPHTPTVGTALFPGVRY